MVDAEPGGGHDREPLVADRVAANLARAVRTLVEAPERPIDVGQLGMHLLEDRELLLALERVAGGVGGMLVDVRQLGGAVLLRLVVEVLVLQRRAQSQETVVLVAQVLPCGIALHAQSVRPIGMPMALAPPTVGVEGLEPSRIRLKGGRSTN